MKQLGRVKTSFVRVTLTSSYCSEGTCDCLLSLLECSLSKSRVKIYCLVGGVWHPKCHCSYFSVIYSWSSYNCSGSKASELGLVWIQIQFDLSFLLQTKSNWICMETANFAIQLCQSKFIFWMAKQIEILANLSYFFKLFWTSNSTFSS
jgi:hypothetical protein